MFNFEITLYYLNYIFYIIIYSFQRKFKPTHISIVTDHFVFFFVYSIKTWEED